MTVLAILATLGAVAWTFMTALANGMSDAPSAPAQGLGLLAGVWLVAAALWLGWWLG